MCAIKPRFHRRFVVDCYSSHPTMTHEEFDKQTLDAALRAEFRLNEDMRLRWHIDTDGQINHPNP